MAGKKEPKEKKHVSSVKKEGEKKLMDEHPFETMSQVQNRYGHGRSHAGSDGTTQDARGSNH